LNRSTNYHTYQNIETLDQYLSIDELEARRVERKLFYKDHINFFKRKTCGKTIRAVEVGSGSSVLLYSLAELNIMNEGVGIELAKGRWEFAEKWKTDENIIQVKNINDNFKNVKLEQGYYDYYICIDNTFSYLYPENPKYPELMLQQANEGLVPNGYLLLDFINFLPIIRENRNGKSWSSFSDTDQYSYGLYDWEFHHSENIIKTKKIYLLRDENIEEIHNEISYVYTLDSINKLLSNNGFVVKEIYSDFEENIFDQEVSQRLVVLATKI